MRKVLITTNHPAPYMDKWFEAISEKYELTVIYHYQKDTDTAAKSWKNFTGYPGYFYEECVSKIKEIIRNQDLIIIGGWNSKCCAKMLGLSFLYEKKTAVFTDYPFHQNKYADLFKKYILYKKLDYVFCATESTEKFIQFKYHLPSEKTRFFPYAADLKRYPIKNVQSDKIRILIANNFIERKGYDILFKALSEFEKRGKNLTERYEFHIAGHGPLFDKYKELAKTIKLNIQFYGWCDPKQYDELQSITDYYIHASLEEPFGIPPLDSMSRGKVTIVSDGVKSTDLLIKNGINGFVYPAHDYSKLAEILAQLINIDSFFIGKQAQKDVLMMYGINKNVEAIDSCLE